MGENVINNGIPLLPLQWSWLHVCLAISCHKNHIAVVANGFKIGDKQFPEGVGCPESLVGNLVLMKGYVTGGVWSQGYGKVTNLNIFSGSMSTKEMVATTAGEKCGGQDGDYLSWKNSSWSLRGAAKWKEVPVEDLCRKDFSIQLLTTKVVQRPDACKQLCSKLHEKGRMASVETPELFDKLNQRLSVLATLVRNMVIWVPMSRKKDGWVDSHTGNEIAKLEFQPGYPTPPLSDSGKDCVIFPMASPDVKGYVNNICHQTAGMGGWYCACHFPERPILTLRGLCKDSHIDQTYLPQNHPLDGRTTYYGNTKSYARFYAKDNQWTLKTFLYNTTALSDEISGRFMLGKQNWTIKGDSKKCHKGKSYIATLKLTSCKDGEFTCDDGHCIKMEKRCDQIPDCKGKSDEKHCQLVFLEEGYNKNIAPIRRNETDQNLMPVNVNVTVTLMKVVEIEETDHSIHLQFQIMLDWKETDRVTYHNLKEDSSLNTLKDIRELWLPLLVYDNTDQKESTRLAPFEEWTTTVAVTRQQNFSRSDTSEVDEIEIFKGPENKLTMYQTYTKEFQCEYKLNRYPFDTQV